MNIEQLEIFNILKRTPPLDNLDDKVLEEICLSIEILYKRKDESILSIGQSNNELFLIIKGAVRELNKNNEVISNIEAGSWLGYSAFYQNGIMQCNLDTIEDTLLYSIPEDIFNKITSISDDIKSFFTQKKSIRLQQATAYFRGDEDTRMLSSKVKNIKKKNSLCVTPSTTIMNVAKLMEKEGRTSTLIIDGDKLLGIVTEREFCKEVTAKALDVNLPISYIMTENPIVIRGTTTASDAMLIMARDNIHHLPFINDNGKYSIITASNIIMFQSHNPIMLISEINSSFTVKEIILCSKKTPTLLVDLVSSSLTAYDIGNLISSVGEAINQRLLFLAERKFGKPPVPYGWLVAGSMARMEQTGLSDQDNALILSDDYDKALHEEYFISISNFVCDGLNDCGYDYCTGNVMAVNPKWRKTISEWKEVFQVWTSKPERTVLLYASMFFDMRVIYGNDELLSDVRNEMLKLTQNNKKFLSVMASNALKNRPPLGVFRQFVLERGGAEKKFLNLKDRGISPIVEATRAYALANNASSLHTQDRLREVARLGGITEKNKVDLIRAYEFISYIRLMHQCKQVENQIDITNLVSPSELSVLEKKHLKDSFDIVSIMQRFLRHNYL